jgi:biotin carboxylase
MNKAYIFVTAGHWQLPAINRAKEMGFYCVAIDSNPDAPGFAVSDMSIVAGLNDLERITNAIDALSLEVCAVMSYCSEVGVFTAAQLRDYYKLGFPGRLEVSIFLDKSEQRRILDKQGFLNPKWRVFVQPRDIYDESKSINYPIVVKPTDSSGSRGVSIAHSADELNKAAEIAFVHSKSKKIIIEQFIVGDEYTVEVAAQKSNIQVLLVTKKIKISTEIRTVASELWSVNPGEKDFQQLSELATKVFNTFGLVKGVGHLEAIKGKDGNFYVVEAAIRGGGFNLANKMVKTVTGFDYCQWCVDTEANIKSDEKILFYKPTVLFFEPSEEGLLQNVSGIQEANLVSEVYVEQLLETGRTISKAVSDSDRVYSAIVSADSLVNLDNKKNLIQSIVKVHYQTRGER